MISWYILITIHHLLVIAISYNLISSNHDKYSSIILYHPNHALPQLPPPPCGYHRCHHSYHRYHHLTTATTLTTVTTCRSKRTNRLSLNEMVDYQWKQNKQSPSSVCESMKKYKVCTNVIDLQTERTFRLVLRQTNWKPVCLVCW